MELTVKKSALTFFCACATVMCLAGSQLHAEPGIDDVTPEADAESVTVTVTHTNEGIVVVTPDGRRVVRHQEPEAHQFHAVRFYRDDLLIYHARLLTRTEHRRDVRPVDVGVHQPDPVPGPGPRSREVRRHRGLADSSFAGTHGNHMLYALQWFRFARVASGLLTADLARGRRRSPVAPRWRHDWQRPASTSLGRVRRSARRWHAARWRPTGRFRQLKSRRRNARVAPSRPTRSKSRIAARRLPTGR